MSAAMKEIQQLFGLSCQVMREAHGADVPAPSRRRVPGAWWRNNHDEFHKRYAWLGNHQGSAALGFYIPNTLDAAILKRSEKHFETQQTLRSAALVWFKWAARCGG